MGTSMSKSNKKAAPNSTGRYSGDWTSWPPAARRKFLHELNRSLEGSDRLIDWTASRRLVGGSEFDFAGHEYLRKIYSDNGTRIVIRKGAQLGATEYGISRALWFTITKDGRVIYFFPTDHDVAEFSRDRFGPIIRESEYLSGLVRDTDTVGYKQIGNGGIFFRGMKSRSGLKSTPADFLIFDEMDEMDPAAIELASKRVGHSKFGWELAISTPTFPGSPIDRAFLETDQRYWLLRCERCGDYSCLEDLFLENHGSPSGARDEICFIRGTPGAEEIVCMRCGGRLDPGVGEWVAKEPSREAHGYQLSKFASGIVSERERSAGTLTKPAALLAGWRKTRFPAEFFNSELGLPYLGADGGLSDQDLLSLVDDRGMATSGTRCVMGVDQGNGLHVVIKQPDKDGGLVRTIKVHHQETTDATFSHLDRFMRDYDVRACVIDAQPNIHAVRVFANRFPGRVYLAYYVETQKGLVDWGRDMDYTPTAKINRTDAFDGWRDVHQTGERRIPRLEGEMLEWKRQMMNIVRLVREDPDTGQKKAIWRKRGADDHYAHADSYAEIALQRGRGSGVRATILGGDDDW